MAFSELGPIKGVSGPSFAGKCQKTKKSCRTSDSLVWFDPPVDVSLGRYINLNSKEHFWHLHSCLDMLNDGQGSIVGLLWAFLQCRPGRRSFVQGKACRARLHVADVDVGDVSANQKNGRGLTIAKLKYLPAGGGGMLAIHTTKTAWLLD